MDVSLPLKRSRLNDVADLSPATLRRMSRSAWSRHEVGKPGFERIIDGQALQINELEKELADVDERNKRNEWASRELSRIMESNEMWKQHCDELQTQLRADAKSRLKREHELHLKIAEREQQVATLLHAQNTQQTELMTVKAELVTCQAKLRGANLRSCNSNRMQELQNDGMPQEMHSLRVYLEDLQNELDKAREEMVQMKTELMQANETLSKQDVEIQTHRLDQKLLEKQLHALETDAQEVSAIKAELVKARRQVEDMADLLSEKNNDEQIREQLSTAQAVNQAQQVKLQAMEEEQYRRINWESEKDQLQAENASLRHALNDLHSVTGEVDVRSVLCQYQVREIQTEQEKQQLQTQLQHTKHDLESLRSEIHLIKAQKEELACAADAAVRRADAISAGKDLLQAEVDFLDNRLKLHMNAAEMLNQQEPRSEPRSDGLAVDTLRAALKQAKVAQANLIEMNKKVNVDLEDARAAKATVEQELRAAQHAIRDFQAQPRKICNELSTIDKSIDLPSENPQAALHREFLEHQIDALKTENDKLRKELLQWHIATPHTLPMALIDERPSSLHQAELIVLKQTVEDYRMRIDKLGQFFVDNSKQFRTAVQDIFGWHVVMKRQVGTSHSAMVELTRSSKDGPTLNVKIAMNEGGEYSISEMPSLLQGTDEFENLVEEYHSNGSLPHFLAGLLVNSEQMQNLPDM